MEYNVSMSKLLVKQLSKLNKNGLTIENVPMSEHCTFKCGGKARILMEINTLENFLSVMNYIESNDIKYYVLGAGSNILVSDKGYDGIIIKLGGDLSRIECVEDTLLECGAGVKLSACYSKSLELELTGLECGAGIPATVGGAVFMNAGAYGFEMSQVVEYVVAYVNGKITHYKNKGCKFEYRNSVFQRNKGIILRVGLRLVKSTKEQIEKLFFETMQKRLQTQPLEYPNAGSVFKRMPDIVVSKLLDECEVKGLTLGGAQVSEKHANFIVNLGFATAQDIYNLIGAVRERVIEEKGVELTTEIKFLGEFDETIW